MTGHSRVSQLARTAAAWALAWIFAAGLYLLLIDTTDLPELVVGAVAAALAATGSELARHQGIVGESIRAGWLARLYRPLMKVPGDVWLVSAVAVRRLVRPRDPAGVFRVVRFTRGEREQLESGREAMAVAFGSFAPNTIIVGIDSGQQVMLAHQLQWSGGRDAIDLLELG